MRKLVIFFTGAIAAFSQPFSIGVKGGVPINDFVNGSSTASNVLSTTTNRYIVGPEFELNLPFGFGVEFDAMYRHYNFQGSDLSGTTTGINTGAWEVRCFGRWLVGRRDRSGFAFSALRFCPFVESGV